MDPHAAPHVGGMPSADGGVMKDPDALKLFVGQIPREYSEDELTDMFAEFGDIYEVMVLRDRATGQSKGVRTIQDKYPSSCFYMQLGIRMCFLDFHSAPSCIGRHSAPS
eukprot:TRINITY_DN12147_c0_g4_i1.p3 TRINITY_DN12147_c0_g4~~TRINITY_DN12147_c0_g4_i1.p3  ORF type:complete len:109 (+),score=17.70 TRINITY_DN12147_c0_g4_i1:261-587(+)